MINPRITIYQFVHEILIPFSRWDILPYEFCLDAYKAWLKETYPDAPFVGPNKFKQALRLSTTDSDTLMTLANPRQSIRSIKRTYMEEPLIERFNLEGWDSHGNITKSAYRGLLRIDDSTDTSCRITYTTEAILFCLWLKDYLDAHSFNTAKLARATQINEADIKDWFDAKLMPTAQDIASVNNALTSLIQDNITFPVCPNAESLLYYASDSCDTCL